MTEPVQPAIEINDLYYSYKGHQAVRGMSFMVNRGSIHGFVGPNGAGKTTTLKILATLQKPQRGRVRVFGFQIVADYKKVRRKIGFMPDHFSMYRQMTVQEYLDFFAAAYGMGMTERTRVIHDVLALTDMEARRTDLIRGLSRGMQQRVSLARVLVHDPELLLLDEPASGLDPRARIELMEILRELRGMGKTIFISSHILSELALLCDSVTVVDRGQVRYTGSMAGLTQRDSVIAEYLLTLAAIRPEADAVLRQTAGVTGVEPLDGKPVYRVKFHREQTTPAVLLRVVLDNGGDIVAFQEDVRHLNEAFMDLTEPGVPPRINAPPPPLPAPAAGQDSTRVVRFPVFAFFERSLRVETRSALMCWARVGLLGVIFLVMLPMQATLQSGMFGAPGLHMFQSIVWIDFVFLSLAGLSYFATAIAEEKEEMTLGLLRMTNLNPVSILLGKSTSRLIGVGMLLLVQLPVTLLAVSLGGIATRQILAAYCTLLAYAFFVCNLALFCSVIFRRSVTATFFSGVLLLGFFWVPSLIESILKGMSVPYQINLAKGGWSIVMVVVDLWMAASPTSQINEIFTTGFAGSPVGFQALSNVGLGVAAFCVSWMLFERFTREQKEDAPIRAPFLKRTGRASRVPAYVGGANALTWKDSVFLGGGRAGAILKFVIFGLIIAAFDLFLASVGGEKINQELIGGTMVWGSILLGCVLLAFEISRLFKAEVQYKTLSSLVLLPITIPELAYRKIAGCLLGLLPITIYFVVGLLLVPTDVNNFVHGVVTHSEAVMALVTGITQYILFLHIVAALSLLIKRGALPLAFVVHYMGGMMLLMPLTIGMFATGSGDAVMVLSVGITVTATICLHYWIGTRLTRLAAEE